MTMTTRLRNALVPILSLALGSAAALAANPPAAPAKGAFQSEIIAQLDDVQKKILSLEDAIPQDKFTWRPAPGVRSIAEAYLHIAFGNYGLTKVATGKEPPAELGWDFKTRDKWDTKTTDKAQIKATLEKAFVYARTAVQGMSDADLDKKVNFFGHDVTARFVLMALLGHDNEHLGQSIAYARANKITPPWSKEK
jgi:uncharacterized damage-inducible protein DinB